MIRAVLWDFGGVLMRTEESEPRTRLAEEYGLSRPELEDLLWGDEDALQATIGAVSAPQHWRTMLARLNLPDSMRSEFQERFFGGDRLDRELVAWIRELRKRYKTGLISNAFDDLRPLLEERLGIADAFDVVVISAEEGIKKPQAGIYQAALQRLGVEPGESVFVDDFLENVKAAQALGMYAVHFRTADQARAEVQGLLDENGATSL